MSHVEVTTRVERSPDALWHEIGSFESVGGWHPMLAKIEADGDEPGAVRTAIGKDGSKQVERLEQVDHYERLYRYTILMSAMPVADYIAEFRVRKAGKDASLIEWRSDFRVTDSEKMKTGDLVLQFFKAGLDNIARRFK